MCGCNSNQSNRSTGMGFTGNRALKALESVVCTLNLEQLKAIDTTGWTPQELAILKSQINIYPQNCSAYVQIIQDIQDRHSGALRNEVALQ